MATPSPHSLSASMSGLAKPTLGAARSKRSSAIDLSEAAGYVWAFAGAATGTWIASAAHVFIAPDQAPFVYLPIIILCAILFGFGPAVLATVCCYLAWDYFFLPPVYQIGIESPHNWILLVSFSATAIATARLASQSRQRAKDAEARERETTVLYKASEEVNRAVETELLLRILVEQIVTICEASSCMVLEWSDTDQSMSIAAQDCSGRLSNAFKTSVLATASKATASLLSKNEASAAPMQPQVDELGLFVPLIVQATCIGVLFVGRRSDEQPFSAQDERLILTLSNHAAVVIAREQQAKRAQQQTRQTAILEERNRLARDVHDTLSHAFTGIKFLLEAADRLGPSTEAFECVYEAKKLATEGAQEARRSVLNLRPVALEAGDLVAAIRQVAHRQSSSASTAVAFNFSGEARPLPDDIEENLLRICQEALTNVQRHSSADKATVDLAFEPGKVRIMVTDNGKGFDPDALRIDSGFGLSNMAERSRRIGGEMSILSEPDNGTSISVIVPLSREQP